jgi:hypothetical protein
MRSHNIKINFKEEVKKKMKKRTVPLKIQSYRDLPHFKRYSAKLRFRV